MGFVVTVGFGLVVSSIHDSTISIEVIIQRTIEGIQRMISPHKNQGEGEIEEKIKEKGAATKGEVIEISLATKRHWELQIRTLQEAPRDPEKLRAILKVKQKECEKAEDSEDIERLIPEIEMLKFVLYLVSK
jgi:hypothetical protein